LIATFAAITSASVDNRIHYSIVYDDARPALLRQNVYRKSR